MESIIDTNNNSWARQRWQPSHEVYLRSVRWSRQIRERRIHGLGKRGIISVLGLQGQVCPGIVWCQVLLGFSVLLGCGGQTAPVYATSRVTGASMAPTIWGDHAKVVCRDCGIEFTANWQPEMRPTRPLPCWNCGGRLRTDQVTVQSGQLVSIDAVAYQVDRPKIGEVVAIRDALGTRIKRIVASPGQTISVRDGLLLRDEQVMTADVPWLLVHDDTHRLSNYSWWQSPDTGWAKTNSGFSITVQESAEQKSKVQPPILLYGHRSPYQGLKPDVVRDDYQGNLTEIRSLQPVNKLGLQFDIEVTVAATIELWNLTEDGYIKDLRSFDTGVHHVNAQWEKAIAEVEPCFNLDPKQPIGIRVTKGSAELRNLVVKRPCVYFSDERDGQSIRFPIRLAEDEYFVIGDNIPQSIDSRHTGPIKQSAILGKVVKTTESF